MANFISKNSRLVINKIHNMKLIINDNMRKFIRDKYIVHLLITSPLTLFVFRESTQ